nr:retrovirus-related Pol polyprotein from transposon TNT 1-94 [Tanacetum cinerariifolium]
MTKLHLFLDMEIWKSTCFIRDLKGNDLLTGSHGTNLYSIILQDINSPNLICLMAKATSSQAWLWNRCLSHLNFDTINLLSKNDIMVGLPKLKFIKDHLCSFFELGKAKRKSFHSKLTPSLKRRLQLLHMDLCGPMRVASINGKRYVLVIVDDYSRYTWTHFLRVVRTDKGKEFLNQTLHAYFAPEGIQHQTSVARTPKQNGVVERRNRTLVEMASDQNSSDPVPECQKMALNHDSLSPVIQRKANVPQEDTTVKMSNELDLLFSLMFDELLNGSSKAVSESSAVSAADASNQRQQYTTPLNDHTTPTPTCQIPTIAPTVISSENINQAETHAKNDQVANDEFINIFSTPVQDQRETSLRHVDSSNMHTFYQRYTSEHRWTKDHPLEQVIGNPSQSVKEQVSRILPRIKESMNATLEAEVLTRSSYSSRTSYAIAADLSEMELKTILIEKMKGNKSIQRSDEQRNLYKALVKVYEADKAILDTYGDSTILKRRREDDDQEGPSAGPNRGSKRQKEGGEQASASTPSEKATKGAGGSTTGTQYQQRSASESAYADEPVQTTCQMEETPLSVYETGADDQPIVQISLHPEWFSQPRKPPSPDRAWNTALPAAQGDAQSWISDLVKQADARSSFNKLLDTPIDFSNFIMHRLNVDILTPDLLAGPTYELMRGSCSSLTKLEYYLEEVYKAMTYQTVDENMKKIIKEQVKEQVKVQVSKILPRIKQAMNEQLEAEVLTRSSHSSKTSYAVTADLSEIELKKILIEKIEGNKDVEMMMLIRMKNPPLDQTRGQRDVEKEKSLSQGPMQTTSQIEEPSHPKFDTCAEDQPIIQSSQHPKWFSQQQKPPSLDCAWNKTVDTLTPELQAGPTYELMKGSCKSLVELEYHLEEVVKATIDQLDWVNLEGQQYPHNLLKPLPLIPNNQGRRVIPFEHFINNDLEYLRGEDLVPRTMWIEEPISYDKHALWGVSHWRRKHQQFYGFAVNRESARDVYSRRRIIDVTELKIVEWHSYKHLDWITMRRDDDKLYKFKEGDFKRLRIQDIEDMLLLLVQGKLTNLTVPLPLTSLFECLQEAS